MREFLLSKGFGAKTLALLNDENLEKLAENYGYHKRNGLYRVK